MRFAVVLLTTLLCYTASFAQVSDFISVKKRNNITLKSVFPGSYLSCRTVYGNDLNGVVQAIYNDSVFLKEYDVRPVPNQWGTYTIDTLGSHLVAFHYRDIETVIFKKQESFTYLKNGAILIIGGLGYAALNVINGKYLKESITGDKNRKSLAIALAVAGAGFLINRLHAKANSEKRYKIVYVCMTCPAPLKPF